MLTVIAKRLAAMALTMLVVSLLLFLLLEISPGSVATKVLGPYSTEEQRRLWLEQNGYFEPLWARYGAWLWNFVTGDFGESIRFKVPVADVLWPRLWNTAVLGFWTFAILIPLSLTLGVLAGMREGSRLDRSISIVSIVTTSVPEFASAVFFSAIFVFGLQWLPGTSGMTSGFDWRQLVLPVLVLVVYDFGYVTRMTRASMAEVMTMPYIRTAILKGLPRQRVILRHALRNALIAPFTVIFAYKGFGALLLEASLNQDIFLIEACAMVAVFVAVSTQVIADIGYALLNPRIRFS